MAERAQLAGPSMPGTERHFSYVLTTVETAILAEELEARADTLELAARSGARLPSYKGGIQEIGNRVRVLRREAERLRGTSHG